MTIMPASSLEDFKKRMKALDTSDTRAHTFDSKKDF